MGTIVEREQLHTPIVNSQEYDNQHWIAHKSIHKSSLWYLTSILHTNWTEKRCLFLGRSNFFVGLVAGLWAISRVPVHLKIVKLLSLSANINIHNKKQTNILFNLIFIENKINAHIYQAIYFMYYSRHISFLLIINISKVTAKKISISWIVFYYYL